MFNFIECSFANLNVDDVDNTRLCTQKIGLNYTDMWKCAIGRSPQASGPRLLLASIEEANARNVHGAPTAFINGELVAVAVEAHGRNLCYVSDERLRSDRELMLHCVSRNAWALNWCDDSLRNDPEFLKEAVGKNGWALPYAHHAHTSNAGLARSAAASVVTGIFLLFFGSIGHLLVSTMARKKFTLLTLLFHPPNRANLLVDVGKVCLCFIQNGHP